MAINSFMPCLYPLLCSEFQIQSRLTKLSFVACYWKYSYSWQVRLTSALIKSFISWSRLRSVAGLRFGARGLNYLLTVSCAFMLNFDCNLSNAERDWCNSVGQFAGFSDSTPSQIRQGSERDPHTWRRSPSCASSEALVSDWGRFAIDSSVGASLSGIEDERSVR